MKNILIDNNIVLDYFSNTRRKKYPESEKCFKYLLNSDFGYISSSSLDNIAYIKMKYLKDEGKNKKEIKENIRNLIQFLIKNFKIAKAIIPVSLYGQPSDMDEINSIAKKYNLFVIEDATQSFGATYKGKRSCNLSYIGCTSFSPAKPLGCFGDGGAVFTNDDE